jgi:hypothetical protein
MPGKNERQGRSANIFFFHEGLLQGHGKNNNASNAAWLRAWLRCAEKISA